MFPACWNFLKDIFTKIVNPMYSAKVDGIPLFTLAFYVFLASLLVRFILPLFGMSNSGVLMERAVYRMKNSDEPFDIRVRESNRPMLGRPKINSPRISGYLGKGVD